MKNAKSKNHLLADTDGAYMMFLPTCKTESNTPDDKFRDIVIEVVASTSLIEILDRLHQFKDKFNVRNETEKKIRILQDRTYQ